jgi:hypothetical protein
VDNISKLAISISRPKRSKEQKLHDICQATMRSITHTNRISLWKFNKELNKINCLMCYEKSINQYSSSMELKEYDYPEYFKYILKEDVILASDARQHPATKCFNETYLKPNNIFSLFDYIFHENFEPCGIICCESVGQQVTWQESDVKILRRIANMASMFFVT